MVDRVMLMPVIGHQRPICGTGRIRHDLGECLPADLIEDGVISRICGRPQPELQGPALSPRPSRIINC